MKNNPQEREKKRGVKLTRQDWPKNSFKLVRNWRVFGDSKGTGLEFMYINMRLSHGLVSIGK